MYKIKTILHKTWRKFYHFLDKNIVFVVLGILLLINILINWNSIFVGFDRGRCFSHYFGNNNMFYQTEHKSFDFDNVSGKKKEFVKKCINGVCTTKENESDLSFDDMRKIHRDIIRQQSYIQHEFDRMNRYLLEQERFFETLWYD